MAGFRFTDIGERPSGTFVRPVLLLVLWVAVSCVPDLALEFPPDASSPDGLSLDHSALHPNDASQDVTDSLDLSLDVLVGDSVQSDQLFDTNQTVVPQSCDGEGECPDDQFCVSGFCCNMECNGPCESCDLVGTEGTCSARACDYPVPELPGVDWQTASPQDDEEFPSDCDDFVGAPCNRANPRFHWPNNSGQKDCFSNEFSVEDLGCGDLAGTEGCSALSACGQDAAYSAPQGWAPSIRFLDKNGTVKDNKTGLIWAEIGPDVVDWQSAVDFCRSQDPANYGPWRLPDLYELMSLSSLGAANPGGFLTSLMKGHGLWSSTTVSGIGTQNYAWSFSEETNQFVHTEKSEAQTMGARCVTGGTGPQIQARFLYDDDVEGKNLVFDARTGLIWMAGPIDVDETGRSWSESLSYCEGLFLAGRRDWRLANINELAGLFDTTREGAAIMTEAFSEVPTSPIWSSTTVHPDPGSAWRFDYFSATAPLAIQDKDELGFGFWCVNRWLTKKDDRVVDLKTGRLWSRDVPEAMNAEDAREYCLGLNQTGLWSLPTIQALRSLISGCSGSEEGAQCAVHDPDCLDGFGLLGEDPCLNQSCAPECDLDITTIDGCAWTPGSWDEDDCDTFWSTSEAIVSEGSAAQTYSVSFTSGSVQIDNPNQLRSVRCVLEPLSIVPSEPVDPKGPATPPGEDP